MSNDRLPRILICTALIAFAQSLAAGETTAPASPTQAYEVLRELGLLRTAAAPGATAPAAQSSAPQASQASPPPPPGAREVLQQLGLLDAPESTPANVPPPPPAPEQQIATVPAAASAPESATQQDLGLVNAPAVTESPQTVMIAAVEPSASPVNPATPLLGSSASDTLQPMAPTASGPLSRAYEMLRAKGLLPGGPVVVKTRALAPQRVVNMDRVLVDKSDRKLTLFRNGLPYREYRISLGGMPNGPKLRAGDLRTPEGTYTLDWRNPHSRFYKSFHISYPNDTDRQRAALAGVDPGGNIMIHGEHDLPPLQRTLRRARSPKDWTEGCIALNNDQMDELWREIADGTPIEIRP